MLIDEFHDGVIIMDKEYNIRYTNKKFC